jgi:hypothetical protein
MTLLLFDIEYLIALAPSFHPMHDNWHVNHTFESEESIADDQYRA